MSYNRAALVLLIEQPIAEASAAVVAVEADPLLEALVIAVRLARINLNNGCLNVVRDVRARVRVGLEVEDDIPRAFDVILASHTVPFSSAISCLFFISSSLPLVGSLAM
jgi:hypothetical protein